MRLLEDSKKLVATTQRTLPRLPQLRLAWLLHKARLVHIDSITRLKRSIDNAVRGPKFRGGRPWSSDAVLEDRDLGCSGGDTSGNHSTMNRSRILQPLRQTLARPVVCTMRLRASPGTLARTVANCLAGSTVAERLCRHCDSIQRVAVR